jgi:hypothetical protein
MQQVFNAVPPAPQHSGERRCAECFGSSSRRVYMSFMLRGGWFCSFLEPDLKTALPCKLNFSDKQKLFEIAERGGALRNLETRQAIEHGIEIGRGGVWLELTQDQYEKLLQSPKRGRV